MAKLSGRRFIVKVANIILDIDGTLWNTTEVVAEAWHRAIADEGYQDDIFVDASRLQSLFGKTMDVIADSLFHGVPEDIKKRLLDKCCEYEQQALESQELDILYPNVRETIASLSESGKKLYIVSNCQSGYIELFIEKNKLGPYIQDKECFGDTGRGKGENISLLLQRNGLDKNETVYVGDTQGDKDASDEAGIAFVYAAYGFGSVDAYDAKIDSFRGLADGFQL